MWQQGIAILDSSFTAPNIGEEGGGWKGVLYNSRSRNKLYCLILEPSTSPASLPSHLDPPSPNYWAICPDQHWKRLLQRSRNRIVWEEDFNKIKFIRRIWFCPIVSWNSVTAQFRFLKKKNLLWTISRHTLAFATIIAFALWQNWWGCKEDICKTERSLAPHPLPHPPQLCLSLVPE